uniref:Uncharacterized protein n=1 Tax=Triticum urartu TaxID=4572 RepID=A0A8R7R2G8_TRIUA
MKPRACAISSRILLCKWNKSSIISEREKTRNEIISMASKALLGPRSGGCRPPP